MSIPTPPATAASTVPWLAIAIIGGIVVAAVAFTLFKKIGRTQSQAEATELGAALGFAPVVNAAADAPPSALGTLKTLTHGRSHRFQHVLRSDAGDYVFQLNYDTGALHGPSRWSYVVNISPTNVSGETVLVFSPSGPDDLAAELGFQDTTVAGRTLRTQDTAGAEALFGSPPAQAWLSEYPEALVEIGDGHLAVLLPGEILPESGGENTNPLEQVLAARKKLDAALAAAIAPSE